MEKAVSITVDIEVARDMLQLAGFDPDEIENASEDEIFEKVLSLLDCYGATYKIN